MRSTLLLAAVLCAIWMIAADASPQSVCYGITSNGRLAHGCQLPSGGNNYTTYSNLARWLGRTWVHCDVVEVIESAYASLVESHPEKRYVYGETGFRTGGEFKPHRNHQNGLSVDFMTPIVDGDGGSVPLPTGITNKFGYSIEFDASGRYKDYEIDFESLAAHLAALRQAAEERGMGISRVVFDPELQPPLRETSSWPEIQDLGFSRKRSWVRHDQHYHVDFEVSCRPLSEWDTGTDT